MFVDIHTHNSISSGGIFVLNVSVTKLDTLLSSDNEGYYSAGYHPWFANEYTEESFFLLKERVSDKRLIAIGECGLDKHSQVALTFQRTVFEKQIELSERAKKPLIIHCVGCFNELIELRKHLKPYQPWIIHGFRGKPTLAAQLLNSGCSLSFGEHFNVESLRITPIERLFIETDESPVALEDLYKKIAFIKECQTDELSAGSLLIERIKKQKV